MGDKIREWSDKLKMKMNLQDYAYELLLLMIAVNLLTYFGTSLLTKNRAHTCLVSEWDMKIPFQSVFIIPYLLAYLQWGIGYIRIAKAEKDFCIWILRGEVVAKIIVCIIYIIFPTTMIRADINGSDLCSETVRFIYRIDTPTKLFPSIHCLESWFCLRGFWTGGIFDISEKIIMCATTILVFLSTIFVKQHVLADMVGAIIVAEMGLFISKKIEKIMSRRKK